MADPNVGDAEDTILEFSSLRDLLRHYSPGKLATVIEQTGIFGEDRFGRTRFVDPEVSHELNEALDPLALYYQSGISDPKYSDDDRLDRLGWWSTERPDIDEVWAEAVLAKPSLKRSRPAQPIPKDSTVDGIIAGLLMFIRGELGNSKHPDFTSQADLTNFLSEKLGFAGTKTRTLAAHFSRANKLAKQSDT